MTGSPLSSAKPVRRISSMGVWRTSGVMTLPGYRANARMPSSRPRRSASTAKRTFAVVDCPYALRGS
ncbi:hypothetical protein [Actinomadura sp. DC4]|uniref:hypothetical protein n=1 Tax=Actinomadura sp. DC4 TaxID=3055069 RepID=UPI0025B0BAF6|nr:hypothetical protein [Actinomadura sp. DC4]MDN3359411.1 hypothetical protein [Actinomadura sp. DC4]